MQNITNDTTVDNIVTKKVVLSDDIFRKLKAIGTLYENELEDKKEANLIGKGIEKIMIEFKENKIIEKLF